MINEVLLGNLPTELCTRTFVPKFVFIDGTLKKRHLEGFAECVILGRVSDSSLVTP